MVWQRMLQINAWTKEMIGASKIGGTYPATNSPPFLVIDRQSDKRERFNTRSIVAHFLQESYFAF